jgi:hypothetical protein
MLTHLKGPTWIQRNGVDVNLGGSGSKRCANNNGLTCIQEEEPEEIDDVFHVVRVSGSKEKEQVAIMLGTEWLGRHYL